MGRNVGALFAWLVECLVVEKEILEGEKNGSV